MARVRSEEMPRDTLIWQRFQPGDFLDGYVVDSPLEVRAAAERGLALPGWARGLLRLRNALVRPFGLKTEAPKDGDALGMFPVTHCDTEQMLLGMNDRHLDFRIGLLRRDGRIHLGTWVHPHNLWGRMYLAAVMPFHILITRAAMRRIARG